MPPSILLAAGGTSQQVDGGFCKMTIKAIAKFSLATSLITLRMETNFMPKDFQLKQLTPLI
jgi:hypothetical protein